jgi:hypothetical protein
VNEDVAAIDSVIDLTSNEDEEDGRSNVDDDELKVIEIIDLGGNA